MTASRRSRSRSRALAPEEDLAVRPYAAGDRDAWDELVAGARVPHAMLHRGYLEYHADRFQDASLLVYRNGALLAALPANRDGDRVASHGGLTFGGFVTDQRMSIGGMLRCFDAVRAFLAADGIVSWTYTPAPHIYHRTPAEDDLYALTRHGARLVRRDVAAALRPAARPAYSKGRRAQVKRAAKLGLTVAREWDFGPYWAVEEETLAERHGVRPVHTLAEIAMLAERFPEAIKLFCARDSSGGLLGGVVIYETPVVAHCQYIAATPDGQRAGAIDAIVDRLLTEEYAGHPWFDFGISTEDQGRVLNAGLARNKESYGARSVVYDRYELSI